MSRRAVSGSISACCSPLSVTVHAPYIANAPRRPAQHTPGGRGYDEFFGYFQHANNYWNKQGHIEATGDVDLCLNRFVDLFQENATYRGGVLDERALDASCSDADDADPSCYEEHLFRVRAAAILDAHACANAAAAAADAEAAAEAEAATAATTTPTNVVSSEKPLFYVHAFHLAHSPLNVPISYVRAADARLAASHEAYDDAGRRNYTSMVAYLDEVVGDIAAQLQSLDLWDDTLVAFLSDNGG